MYPRSMIFTIYGCKVKISFLLIGMVAGIILLDESKTTIWGLIAALMHEFGHIFAMTLKNNKPQEINFDIFDIKIKDNNRSRSSYGENILILFAGPCMNLSLAAIFFLAYFITGIDFLLIPMSENLILGILNILPIESLDGGQILYCLLVKKLGIQKSEKIVCIVSFIFLVPLSILGFTILFKSKYNMSLFVVSCYLMVMIVLKKGKFY